MAEGRIDFLDQNGEIIVSTEYENFKKMCRQIELEDQFGDPFIAHVYGYERIGFRPKNTTSKLRHIQDLIPDDAEKDRFWVYDDKIVAMYFNPNGGPNEYGDFMEHNFTFDRIIQADEESETDEDFMDALYGDASNDTFCIDIGTDSFDSTLEEFPSGFRPEDDSPAGIRKWMVETAKAKQAEDICEIRVNPILYFQPQSKMSEEQLVSLIQKKLEDAGFCVLDDSIEIQGI